MTVSQRDRRLYRDKVRQCLDVLAQMLHECRFETGPPRVGLELELHLVDGAGWPAMTNAQVLKAIADPAWASELGQFNIEINIPPYAMGDNVFSQLERSVQASLEHAASRADLCGTRLVMVGILPTLRESDAVENAMSPNPRYRLLNEQIMAARGEEVRLAIEGNERLLTYVESILPEAACTSMQCHLQVSPDAFASYWNASQSVAGIQVAIGANAPFLFGKELWQETRIILFEQATDTRSEELKIQGVRPRVWFGDRWITTVFDLFEENLRYFPALLPLSEDEDPAAALERGEAPQLAELTLHNGTVYRWNRPVYAVVDGTPHLRVENRVLPSGPTVVDAMANAAFYYGLIHALAQDERPVWSRMSFQAAADNLVSGARNGIDAQIYWPDVGTVPATELILRHLLPLSYAGLQDWGVGGTDAGRLLSIIERRCLTGQNGAAWQVKSARAVRNRGIEDRFEVLRLLTQEYIGLSNNGDPVHSWPVM